MYDLGKVAVGLAVFVLLFTSPLWYNVATGGKVTPPDLKSAKAKQDHCIEDTEYMKSNHMDLLNSWRDSVVREGNRVYTSRLDGKRYNMSLSNTCLDCHGGKTGDGYVKFCRHCHNYNDVDPFCWDCHLNFEEL